MRQQSVFVEFVDHLTAAQVTSKLEGANEALAAAALPVGMVVDVRRMTGYDTEARAAFVDWHRGHKTVVRRVAIITSNKLWAMVIRAMSLASSVPMRPFANVELATAWAALE